MLSWFRRRPAPVPARDLESILGRSVWHYAHLPLEWRERHAVVVRRMAAERRWEGAGGLVVTDEMRVTVAGVAALLTLGYDEPYVYADLPAIVLYPGAFDARRRDGGGWLDLASGTSPEVLGENARLGEAWRRGPLVLSWPDAARTARRAATGENLVIHEFAHYVDGLNGDTDGLPMVTGAAALRWPAVVGREFDRLAAQARRGELTLLDHYGATSHAEFFAVATECFFERPHDMRRTHGELYGLMVDFYRQDPAEWLPPPAPRRRAAETLRPAPLRVDVSGLGLSPADAAFAEAQELLEAGEPERAAAALGRVLREDPRDAEALTLRAEAHLDCGRWRAARDDALAAIALEPDEVAARLAAAESLFELGDDAGALGEAGAARRLDPKSSSAWFYCGVAASELGRLREARRALTRAVALDRLDADALHWLAKVCELLGDHRAAARHSERAAWLAGNPAEDPDGASG